MSKDKNRLYFSLSLEDFEIVMKALLISTYQSQKITSIIERLEMYRQLNLTAMSKLELEKKLEVNPKKD